MSEYRQGSHPFPVALWAVLLAGATQAAYVGSGTGPFVFDDLDSIVKNPTIRNFGELARVWSPPFASGQTVGGRPVLNFSFALNYAFGGIAVGSYHAVNLLIHVFAGLVLFGLARRTLRNRGASPGRADFGGFALALLWLVHPLQTEAVTYVVQRAESLMGFFYLLTLYSFVRYVDGESRRKGGWAVLSILACLAGMGTKEVMVSAPVIVLLYDRTFISGTLREAWRRHQGVLLGLASTWMALAGWILTSHGRGGTVGRGVAVSWTGYLLTQGPAILHYLRLAFWPHALIFDYGAEWVNWAVAAPAVAMVLLLVIATLVGLWRGTAWGFLAAWFFAVLAPTSLVPGIRQTLAEHRMYLALAPLLGLVVGGGALWPGWGGRGAARVGGTALLAVAAVLACLTFSPNRTYQTHLALWNETVARRPLNPYAHNNLGDALKGRGRTAEARLQFVEALRLKPDLPEAHNNLGNILREEGRLDEAVLHYQRALAIRPDYAEAANNLGVAETELGHLSAGLADFDRALALDPNYEEARYDRGIALAKAGRWPEALAADQAVLRVRPDFAEARLNFGVALAHEARVEEALAEFQRAARINPNYAAAHLDAANALVFLGKLDQAVAEYQAALRLEPGNAVAKLRLESIQAMLATAPPRP
jgi:protein O-mannosyl-transferase